MCKIPKSACELPDGVAENRIRGPLPVLFHIVLSVCLFELYMWVLVCIGRLYAKLRYKERFRNFTIVTSPCLLNWLDDQALVRMSVDIEKAIPSQRQTGGHKTREVVGSHI